MSYYPENRERLAKLGKLAKTALEHHREALALAKKAEGCIHDALAAAGLCGKALNDAREECEHGEFLPWLKTQCDGISQRTAYRYMAVAANLSLLANLSEPGGVKTLKQAYQLLGIMPPDPEREPCEPKPLAPARFPDLASSLARLTPAEQWQPGEREALKERVTANIAILNKLLKRLS